MSIQKSKVYVLLDSSCRITGIDGGYTVGNIRKLSDWVLIDEGYGDRYNLCQSHYLPGPLTTHSGAYRYKLVDGKPVECTAEEIAEQEAARVSGPSQLDRLEAQLMYTALMTDTLLEV